MRRVGDLDDARQEAQIVFLNVKRTYQGKVDNPAWFMALYKRSLAGHFHDLATRDTRQRHTCNVSDMQHDDDDAPAPEAVGDTCNTGELLVHVSRAPAEIKQVLSLLFNAPTEIVEFVCSGWGQSSQRDATTSEKLCKFLGIPPQRDLLKRVKSYLTS